MAAPEVGRLDAVLAELETTRTALEDALARNTQLEEEAHHIVESALLRFEEVSQIARRSSLRYSGTGARRLNLENL